MKGTLKNALIRWGASVISAVIILTSVVSPVVAVPSGKAMDSTAKIVDLRINDLIDPIGVDTPNPIFSWKMESDKIGARQTAYRIVVNDFKNKTVWDSEWVESGISVAVKYGGEKLRSQTKYTVSVTVKDENGAVTKPLTGVFFTAFFEEDAFADTEWISYSASATRDLTKYTIDFDFKITAAAQGFCFGMDENASKYFLWQVSAIESTYTGGTSVLLRPHLRDGGWKATPGAQGASENATVDVTKAIGYNSREIIGKTVHERIEVDGLTVKTYFGKDVSSLTLAATHVYGSDYANYLKLNNIGFRHNLIGPLESASYDNIVIRDENGTVIYSENFDSGNPSLSGNIEYSVKEGELHVGTGKEGIGEATLVFSSSKENSNSLPVFRKQFNVGEGLKSAYIYSSGLGVYEQYINGVRIGNRGSDGTVTYDELKPGYTEGVMRRMYNTYDVTWMLNEGENNAISAISSTSWWNANDGYLKQGDVSAYFAKLVLTYENGKTEVINTDTTWKTSKAAPVLAGTTIYQGEKYDANIDTSWMYPSFNDSEWNTPSVNTEFKGVLTAQVGETIRVRDDLEITPISYHVYKGVSGVSGSHYGTVKTVAKYGGDEVVTLEAGQTLIVDFGQNFAGWEEFTVTAPKGTVITIDHAEMLNDNNGEKKRGNDGPEGSIYDVNYRGAAAITKYTCSGEEKETYHPTFTYYGFRYAEIEVSNDTVIHGIRGQIVTSVQEDTAWMTTSDADVNQLISNVKWGMYSNYLGIPTDCPQRSERFGWTGDTQIFAHTGLILGNNKSFLHKFTYDLQDGQITDPSNSKYGAYPSITPGAYHLNCYGDFGWGDCGIILPYYLYVMSGDVTVIETNWDAMRLYMDEYLADRRYGGEGTFGDWLSYESNSTVGKNIIGTAYHTIDALMMADMAKAIGDTEAEMLYKQTYMNKKTVFKRDFVKADGTLVEATQSACLYALYADLVDDPEPVIDQLITNIERNGNKLQTGFLGTAIIMPTLTKIGRNDVAYKLLLQHDNPSWLYSVDQGATTIWERWNSYTKAEGFGDADMNSFNHYSYGAVLGWMYSDMAGIDYDINDPGFKHIVLSPAPDRLLPVVKASYESPYGTIVSNMEYTDDGKTWTYSATVPANTTATINVPVEDMTKLTVNGKPSGDLNLATDGLEYVKYEDGIATFNAVAGSFTFVTSVTPKHQINISADAPSPLMPPVEAVITINGNPVEKVLPASLTLNEGDIITISAKCMNSVDYELIGWINGDNSTASSELLTHTVNGTANITAVFKDMTMKSLAVDKPVNAKQTNSQWAASYLVDGFNSYLGGTNGWSAGGYGSTTFKEVTAVIDLEENKLFDRIHLYPRNDLLTSGVMNCPTVYSISVSDNGNDWTVIHSETNGSVSNGFDPIVISFNEQISARYVKIGVTGVNQGDEYGNVYVQLSELGIYCTKHTIENGACTNCGYKDTADPEITTPENTEITTNTNEVTTPESGASENNKNKISKPLIIGIASAGTACIIGIASVCMIKKKKNK